MTIPKGMPTINQKYSESDQQEFDTPVDACKVVRDILANEPKKSYHHVGGGTVMSLSGHTVYVPSEKISTVEEDTNSLMRAYVACQEGLVLFVNEKGKSLYVDKKDYEPLMKKKMENQANTKKDEKCIIC